MRTFEQIRDELQRISRENFTGHADHVSRVMLQAYIDDQLSWGVREILHSEDADISRFVRQCEQVYEALPRVPALDCILRLPAVGFDMQRAIRQLSTY